MLHQKSRNRHLPSLSPLLEKGLTPIKAMKVYMRSGMKKEISIQSFRMN
jgi:hypothetical protein